MDPTKGSSTMNSVQLIGRLTHDPQPLPAGAGRTLVTLRVAIPGRREDAVDFVTVKVWGRSAKAALEHLTRGRRVAVSGRLEHFEWTEEDGRRGERLVVVADRVIFLDKPAGSRAPSREARADEASPASAA